MDKEKREHLKQMLLDRIRHIDQTVGFKSDQALLALATAIQTVNELDKRDESFEYNHTGPR